MKPLVTHRPQASTQFLQVLLQGKKRTSNRTKLFGRYASGRARAVIPITALGDGNHNS